MFASNFVHRKFWRNELVRLKYHNPAVPMTIDRNVQQTEPATLSIHFAPGGSQQTSTSATSSPAAVSSTTSTSTPSDAVSTVRVEAIDVTGKHSNEILSAIITATKAYPIEPTAEDQLLIEDLAEQEKRNSQVRALHAEVRARALREKEMLAQARGDVAARAAE